MKLLPESLKTYVTLKSCNRSHYEDLLAKYDKLFLSSLVTVVCWQIVIYHDKMLSRFKECSCLLPCNKTILLTLGPMSLILQSSKPNIWCSAINAQVSPSDQCSSPTKVNWCLHHQNMYEVITAHKSGLLTCFYRYTSMLMQLGIGISNMCFFLA